MCGTRHCWPIYYLFPFFHLSNIFQVPSMCQAELSTWEKRCLGHNTCPQAAAKWGLWPSRGQPACRCRRELVGNAGLAVSGALLQLPGGLPSTVSAPPASHLFGLLFSYDRLLPCEGF